MIEPPENIGEYECSGSLLPRGDTFGTGETPDHDTPEARLWLAVLERALLDLRHPLEQAKIQHWFMTDDYIDVCSLAGIDPDVFIKYALQIPCTKHVLNL